jgi:ABC-type glycerol-3-phosphate transport system substrate-binding protein
VSLVTTDDFKDSFVDVAAKDLIIPDENGVEQIWGLPLYVDTLALYYNDSHFEDAMPAQGEPSSTWEGIKNDVSLLNKQDQSFERFARSGIALGRGDNILRAFDVLAMMMLQYKTGFYTGDYTKVLFGNDANALTALELYTSFGLPSKKNYSWNKYLADSDSSEKELSTFARGKVSMIFGYSYTYEDLINEVNRLDNEGEASIDWGDIKIAAAPQVNDPETSAEARLAFADYFAPVVSRTSTHSDVAWDFLLSMTSSELLREYNQSTHRPSARRSLINEQVADPIYGIFASQVGYATSLTMSDATSYEGVFLNGIDSILGTARAEDILLEMSKQIQALIPSSGIKPTYVAPETPEE